MAGGPTAVVPEYLDIMGYIMLFKLLIVLCFQVMLITTCKVVLVHSEGQNASGISVFVFTHFKVSVTLK